MSKTNQKVLLLVEKVCVKVLNPFQKDMKDENLSLNLEKLLSELLFVGLIVRLV